MFHSKGEFIVKKIFTSLFLFFFVNLYLLGCAPPPVFYNMSPKDLKIDKYLYKTWTISKSIHEIQKQLAINAENCGPHFNLVIDPLDSKKARVMGTLAGLTDTATVFIMEFTQNNEHTTSVVCWSNDSIIFKKTHADKLIQAIEDPFTCDGSF